jgi:hypothetical protein
MAHTKKKEAKERPTSSKKTFGSSALIMSHSDCRQSLGKGVWSAEAPTTKKDVFKRTKKIYWYPQCEAIHVCRGHDCC